jgi:tRNA threonylcarbamoyladenosine modification (KEOPS) complex Cgi121 subunit
MSATRAHARVFSCGEDTIREDIKARLAAANPGSVVQTVGAGVIRNAVFAEMLAAQTFQAESSDRLLAKKPEVDLLLRLAGTTQISRAIKEGGARVGEPFLLVVAGRSVVRGIPALKGKELPRSKLTETELARIEMAALLDAIRA